MCFFTLATIRLVAPCFAQSPRSQEAIPNINGTALGEARHPNILVLFIVCVFGFLMGLVLEEEPFKARSKKKKKKNETKKEKKIQKKTTYCSSILPPSKPMGAFCNMRWVDEPVKQRKWKQNKQTKDACVDILNCRVYTKDQKTQQFFILFFLFSLPSPLSGPWTLVLQT